MSAVALSAEHVPERHYTHHEGRGPTPHRSNPAVINRYCAVRSRAASAALRRRGDGVCAGGVVRLTSAPAESTTRGIADTSQNNGSPPLPRRARCGHLWRDVGDRLTSRRGSRRPEHG